MKIRSLFACVALSASVTTWAAAASSRPALVVALDGSRSIRAADIESSSDLLGRVLAGLPSDTPTGLIVFDDDARWEVPVGTPPTRVIEAVARIAPAGRFTVMREAVVLAARRLADGGAVLLITDGRDEDSAATVEDVARECAAHRVRIVTLAAGKSIDEHSLRRLALLTGGAYLGRQETVSPAALKASLAQAWQGLEPPEPAATPVPAPQASATPIPAPAAASGSGGGFLLLPAAIGALVIAAVAALIWGLRGRHANRTCPVCGSLIAPWETECSYCLVAEQAKRPPAAESAAPIADAEALLDPSVFNKAPVDEPLDKTFALEDRNVLTVRQRRRQPHSYFLHPDETFSVGRASGINSLSIEDPTLSGQHFKIVPKNNAYFIVDLDTTNGTLVNGERVRARRLRPGDVIRAGEVEFDFKVQFTRVT